MTWVEIFQGVTGFFAALGAWFIYDLIREFKSFKKETTDNVYSLKQERHTFQNTVRNAELSIGMRVNDMQKIHNEFTTMAKQSMNELKSELTHLKNVVESTSEKAENFEEFLKKALQLSRALNERIKAQEKELQNLRVVIGDTTIIKGGSGK